jgi:hypothetical protein
LSLSTIETPFFGLDFPGYVDPRVPYWHLGLHMNIDLTAFLVEGREDGYLRHFSASFKRHPMASPPSAGGSRTRAFGTARGPRGEGGAPGPFE